MLYYGIVLCYIVLYCNAARGTCSAGSASALLLLRSRGRAKETQTLKTISKNINNNERDPRPRDRLLAATKRRTRSAQSPAAPLLLVSWIPVSVK